jgi:hypothetical protein
MTGPDGIALATLTGFAYLILNHQRKHRSTTRKHTRRTEHRHGHQDTQNRQPQHTPGEEDHHQKDHGPRSA